MRPVYRRSRLFTRLCLRTIGRRRKTEFSLEKEAASEESHGDVALFMEINGSSHRVKFSFPVMTTAVLSDKVEYFSWNRSSILELIFERS